MGWKIECLPPNLRKQVEAQTNLGSPKKASDKEVEEAYTAQGSIWKAAEVLGMCGQTVHERLMRQGFKLQSQSLTLEEQNQIRLLYKAGFKYGDGSLDRLAEKLDRSKQTISRFARKQGWTNRKRKRSGEIVADRIQTKGRPKARSGKTSWKAGWRCIAGRRIYFRSRWEYNYGCYLQWLKEQGQIREWEHEPTTFWFDNIKRGVRSYLPDYQVFEHTGADYYVEVKGWMDPKSKTKLKRMQKYHPSVSLRVVDAPVYRKLAKQIQQFIPGWEFD